MIIVCMFLFPSVNSQIGIHVSVGVPSLTKTSNGLCLPDSIIKFNEGDLQTGSFNVEAKNIGDERGGFVLQVKSCTEGFEAGDNIGFTLDAVKRVTQTLKTTAQTRDGIVKGSCTIELKESLSQKTDTCTVNLEATTPANCEEGRTQCSFSGETSIIKECKNNKEVTIKECGTNDICDVDEKGNLICREKSEQRKNNLMESGIFVLIAGIFVFLIYLLTKSLIKQKKNKEEDNKFCGECGEKIPQEYKHCPECGKESRR